MDPAGAHYQLTSENTISVGAGGCRLHFAAKHRSETLPNRIPDAQSLRQYRPVPRILRRTSSRSTASWPRCYSGMTTRPSRRQLQERNSWRWCAIPKRKYRSDALRSAHVTVQGLHRIGLVDKKTMREFVDSCLTSIE